MSTLHEFAPAKLNLYLHITGRRPDGYHDLDSLVAFAGIGDEVHLTPTAEGFSFVMEGPQALVLRDEPEGANLVVKAAHSLAALTNKSLNVRLTLIKNLPVASGIGGGSSDAAAALRVLARHWGLAPDDRRLTQAASQHGQDVPVCLAIENNYITATGTSAGPVLPYVGVVLINPNKGLSTPAVYKAYKEAGYGFSPQANLTSAPHTIPDFIDALKKRSNDLYPPACFLMPEIKDIIEVLEKSGSLLARMSGSGATCFGLYPDRARAEAVATSIRESHPEWWVAGSILPYHRTAKDRGSSPNSR